jgi:hypothetical protein
MVVDAVTYEPVSTPKFPANREINREFRQFAWWAQICTLTREQIQRLAAKFPTQPNREFLQKNREFVQENREIESSCRAAFQTMFSEGPGHSSA